MRIFKRLFAVGAMILFSALPVSSANAQGSNLQAFAAFVLQGNYEDATFYISNGFVSAGEVDTSQLFYDVLMSRWKGDILGKTIAADTLYNYLAAVGPIDLNHVFNCGEESRCLLVNDLFTGGTRPAEMAWFVARGLDLNTRIESIIPATVPLMVRFGGYYRLDELNWFVTNGMVLGDEAYSIEELINYTDSYLAQTYPYDKLHIPSNFLNLGNQNLLDLLVMVLATPTRLNAREESKRREVLCNFISYAAPSYRPSYDYLLHVLYNVTSFRGENIGGQKQGNGGIYQPFPTSCVLLIQAMATSHAQLEQVISAFAAAQDVKTANWLIRIKEARK